MEQIKVLLAHDSADIRARLRRTIEREPCLMIAGEAADSAQAVELAGFSTPEVAIVSLSGSFDGLEATQAILKRHPSTRVIAWIHTCEESAVKDALVAGARGLIEPAAEPGLIEAIRSVARGEFWLGPGVKAIVDRMLLEDLVRHLQQRASEDGYQLLTAREREIMQFLVQGRTSKEIANILDLSVYTVDTHRSRILQKLNLHSVADLILYGLKRGIVN